MNYRSTRNSALNVTSAHAITKGLSDEGGLYVPESIPQLSKDEILAMCDMSYADRAFEVFSRLLTDFTADEIRHCVDSAYNDKNFDSNNIAELAKLIPGTYVLELWHGPTCAFKDMALQILPYLLTTSAKKTVDGKQIAILVATSGDTGKAALEGFKDVDGTSISVFYPEDGVSKMQKRQMTTQEGKNVNVCAVKGNFDDCQNGVKAIFTDKAIADRLAKNNILEEPDAGAGLWRKALHHGRPEGVGGRIRREDQRSRSYRKLRQYPCGLLCKADGYSGKQAHLRF